LFDLAGVEANPVGASRRARSVVVPALRAEYTSDGGHLNTMGRAVVAGAFERFLADVRSRRTAA
jgi:hypothetical protein